MKASREEMAAILETPGAVVREAEWGGMHAGFETYHARTDLSPLFKGLPHDSCQCPHWGYVIKGAYRVRYTDGTEEVYRAGEAYYMPPGHSPVMDPDTEIIEFSPMEAFAQTMSVVERNFPAWLEGQKVT